MLELTTKDATESLWQSLKALYIDLGKSLHHSMTLLPDL